MINTITFIRCPESVNALRIPADGQVPSHRIADGITQLIDSSPAAVSLTSQFHLTLFPPLKLSHDRLYLDLYPRPE
ncbi:hypothetical protein CY34DRAFT_622145 [Suillus luteus UH-Slu-Lm8-n1]|uniref:Uncharacterized protein n=1 Tax=Suillus luteus UH-Slu-Lm8-n1 TaxID=930992 RepID=A0A0C9ZAX2_9AGAM|nr:hypothetical protein CY34DRAFT_622145 [Suillus luteus UH-Slu-Lm8-n1]